MTPLTAADITLPGAYEWTDDLNVRHVGFLQIDRRGEISGPFVSEDGSSRAIRLRYSDGSFCEGIFYGPLANPHLATPA